MHDKKQSVATSDEGFSKPRLGVNRFDFNTELGRRRWIRVAKICLSEEQYISWKAGFDADYPSPPQDRLVSSTLSEGAISPPAEAESHVCLSSSGVSVIDGVKFVDDNEIRELARRQAGPFLTEIHDDACMGITRFKRWNHRVEKAYAEIRRKLQLPPE